MKKPSPTLPEGILAKVLNSRNLSQVRSKKRDGKYVIHVSDLMKSETNNVFCPREFVLSYHSSDKYEVRSHTPGLELLYAFGNALHDHIRNIFIKHSPYGKYAYGRWTCLCKAKAIVGTKPLLKVKCKKCDTYVDRYNEYSLKLPRLGLVGHPDFLLKFANGFYLYEIKSINRKDIEFDDLTQPLGDHHLQNSFYYWMMQQLGYRISKMLRYVYVDRDPRKIFRGEVYREFKKEVSKFSRIQPFFNKAIAVREAIDTGVLPQKICDSFDCPRAKNCSRVVECFSTMKG